jgi:ABC-2 type transport system ATP-binding protein
VRELREQHDATILITTHDMEEADALCDRVAIIDQGAIVAMGETAILKQQIAALMGQAQEITMNDVFMHYTAAHRITADDVKRYGSWEKAFKALEAQREENDNE